MENKKKCPICNGETIFNGFTDKRIQRYRCKSCGFRPSKATTFLRFFYLVVKAFYFAMKKKGFSLVEIAAIAGTDPQNIANWIEKAKEYPGFYKMFRSVDVHFYMNNDPLINAMLNDRTGLWLHLDLTGRTKYLITSANIETVSIMKRMK